MLEFDKKSAFTFLLPASIHCVTMNWDLPLTLDASTYQNRLQ